MKFFYLDLLLKSLAFIPLDSTAQFTNSYQNVEVLLSYLSLSGYVIPIESSIIGILIFLLAHFLAKYSTGIVSNEKFKLVINILQKMNTPLIVLRNQLEDIVDGGLPEITIRKVRFALEHTEHIINYHQNSIALDKADWKSLPQTPAIEFELHTYMTTVVNQCRPYANSRHVRLEIFESSGYIACKLNEVIMTAALQHLLNRMIEITAPGNCINIKTSLSGNSWELYISNCKDTESGSKNRLPFIPVVFPLIHRHNDLWTVRKIIRLHNGKITGYERGNLITFQIAIPIDNVYRHKTEAKPEPTATNKDGMSQAETHPCVLLVMADRQFGDYLKTSLTSDFHTFVLESPELAIDTSIRQHPDAIIIDETINGIYGDELCSQIKSNKTTSNIPVVLLVKSGDNESYLSHAGSGADRLELRTVNITRLRTDIHMLIDSHEMQRKQIEQFLANAISTTIPTTVTEDDDSRNFIKRVQELLIENLETEKYTIDILCADIGMCRTAFYKKMKEITGMYPKEYIFSFKMEEARKLLASKKYSVTDIACMLGYCDAKYFGKRFKDFYHVCPTDYIKSITG